MPMRLLLAFIASFLISGPAVAAPGEYTSTSGPGTPCVAIEGSRHVSEVCFHFDLAYDVATLLGEPVVESRLAWTISKVRLKSGTSTGEILARGAQHVDERVREAVNALKLTQGSFAGRLPTGNNPVWLPLKPGAFKASGEGFSFNTPGSPNWAALFLNEEDGCASSRFVPAEQAKAQVKNGVTFTSASICDARFANLGALDKVLEETCTVAPADGKACAPVEKGAGAPKSPLADALKGALKSELNKQQASEDGQTPPAPARAQTAALERAQAKLSPRREAIGGQRERALQTCRNSKPVRPVGGESQTLQLTATPFRDPCRDSGNYRACDAAREQKKRERARRQREEKARREARFRDELAQYEREIAVWPQTLATCERDAEASYRQAVADHQKAVEAEAREIERLERASKDLTKSLSKALRPGSQ